MLELRIGNRRVSPSQLGRELTKAVNRGIEKSLEDRARRTRCPRHARNGRVVKRGGRLYFEGCCEEHTRRFSSR